MTTEIQLEEKQKDFFTACKRGDIHTAKMLYNKGDIDISNSAAFRHSCGYGHKEIAEWLWEENLKLPKEKQFDINYKDSNVFHFTCMHGHFEIAKWIYRLGGWKNIDINIVMAAVCKKGYLDIAKWISSIKTPKVDYTWNNSIYFREAYQLKRAEVLDWLLSTYRYLHMLPWIVNQNDEQFVKKLVESGDIDDSVIDNAILESCKTGNVNIYDYLSKIRTNRHFRIACRNGQLVLAKHLFDPNIISRRTKAFATLMKCVERSGHVGVFAWLQELLDEYNRSLIGDIIVSSDDD